MARPLQVVTIAFSLIHTLCSSLQKALSLVRLLCLHQSSQSFIKNGRGVEGILRFYLRNFKDCNVGITDVTAVILELLTEGIYEISR
jgi:hypothetical protein